MDIQKTQKFQAAFPREFATNEAVAAFIEHDLVKPYAPETPIQSDNFVTMGSCFSQQMFETLNAAGLNVMNFSMSERLFSTFALHDFFKDLEHGVLNPALADGVAENASQFTSLAERLRSGCAVIITLGIGMCWFNKETNEIAHDIVPRSTSEHDPIAKKQKVIEQFTKHEMRVTSVAANKENLIKCIDLIMGFNADNKVILTVSPVPLQLVHSDEFPLLSADWLSKSTLRMAIAEIEQENRQNVFYFPSYEIVKGGLAHSRASIWGNANTDGNPRHLDPQIPQFIAALFMRYFSNPKGSEI